MRHYEIGWIFNIVKRHFQFAFWALLIISIVPIRLAAQADSGSDGNVSLGDLARYLREHKQAESAPVIDNDNFAHVMDEAEKQKPQGIFRYAINSVKNMFQVSSEDVTCSLSFNANASALLTDFSSPHKMPADVLAKLTGPARIDGDNLEVTVHNASNWTVREITIGLTITHPDASQDGGGPRNLGAGNLLSASLESVDTTADVEKEPDTTVLFHLKGDGTPLETTIFRQALNAPLEPGEQWHWAIVDAEGVPPASTSQPATTISAGSAAPQLSSQMSQISAQGPSDNSLSTFRQISIPETGPLAFPGPSTPTASQNHP